MVHGLKLLFHNFRVDKRLKRVVVSSNQVFIQVGILLYKLSLAQQFCLTRFYKTIIFYKLKKIAFFLESRTVVHLHLSLAPRCAFAFLK